MSSEFKNFHNLDKIQHEKWPNLEVYFCNFSRVTRSGEATKIDEYVPTITPTRRTKAKSRVDSPPMKYKAARARKMVKDVFIERPKVWVTDLPTVSENVSFPFQSTP